MRNRQDIDKRELERIANSVRKKILALVYKTKGPHIGSSFSCVEILVSLYSTFLKVTPQDPQSSKRDRFVFSKGHAAPALYSVLWEHGFLCDEDLDRFAIDGGCFEQHPSKDLSKGIEVSTGSLGHGLSIGVGMAYAAKQDGTANRTCVLISDGELNEGSTWEALLFSSQHKLSNLLLVVDYNKMHALGFTKHSLDLDPLAEKFAAFGWSCTEVNGHHFTELLSALGRVPFQADKPSVIIAHTVKGKGISVMENNIYWHYHCPSESEYALFLDELSRSDPSKRK